jgi:hypothetical protein
LTNSNMALQVSSDAHHRIRLNYRRDRELGHWIQNIQRRRDHFTQFMSRIVDPEPLERIRALEEWTAQRDREIAELSARLSRGSADFARLAAAVEAIRASSPRPSPAAPSIPAAPALSAPSVSATKPRNAGSAAAAPGPPSTQERPPAVALPAAPAGLAYLIVADFPALLTEFRGKCFLLLWRGSRDGFLAGSFHSRCCGHAPTLTLI